MALSIELKRRLDDIEEPLSKRVRLAEDVFHSQRFPLTTRRSIALRWLCDLVSSDSDDLSWIESIRKCFEATFVHSDIELVLKQTLLRVLQEKLNEPTIETLKCFVCVITHLSMRQYLVTDLNALSNVLKVAIKTITTLHKEDNIIMNDELNSQMNSIMKCMVEYYNCCTDKDVFYCDIFVMFLREILKSLLIFKDENSNDECINMTQQCMFPKYNTNSVDRYKEFLQQSKPKYIALSIEILTQAFAKSYSDKFENIFVLYKQMLKTNAETYVLSIQHQNIMINILKNQNIIWDIEQDNESFLVFLQKYAIESLCKFENPFVDILSVLNTMLLINPLIIEPHLKEILIKTMLMEKNNESCIEEYTKFLQLCIQALSKLNRVHKLPALLLNDLETTLRLKDAISNSETFDFKHDDLRIYHIEHVWPIVVSEMWGDTMKGLNASVTWGTFKALLYHLEHSCLVCLQTHSSSPSAILTTQITLRFIDSFLINCELPNMIKDNHTKMSTYIKEAFDTLSKIAIIITKMKVNSLLFNWIHTVYTVGEFALMIKYYWQSLDSDIDICLIQHYLSENKLIKISKFIEESGCIESKKYLSQVSLQNLRSTLLSPVREKTTSSELIINACLKNWEQFLCSKTTFKTLYPLIPIANLIDFINNVVPNIITPEYIHVLKLEYIQENEKFTMIVLFCILKKIGELISISDNGLKKYIHHNFNIFDILQNKEKFIEFSCQIMHEKHDINLDKVDVNVLNSYLKALLELNLPYFDQMNKACTFIFITSIIIDYRSSLEGKNRFVIDSAESVLTGLLESGPTFDLDSYFTETMYLKLSTWFSNSPMIIASIIEMNLKENSTVVVTKLTKITKKITKNSKNMQIELNSLCEIILMPTVILNAISKTKKIYSTELKPAISKLRKKCLNLISDVIIKCPSEQSNDFIDLLLPSYVFLLQTYMKDPEKFKLDQTMTNILTTYLKYSLQEQNLMSENAHTLISVVARNQIVLHDYIPENFVIDLWNIYLKINFNTNQVDTLIKVLLENCTDVQFQDIILNQTKNTLNSCGDQLSSSICLWIGISECNLNVNKSKVRLVAITALCQNILSLTLKFQVDDTILLTIFKLYLALINNHLNVLNSAIVDTILGTLLTISFQEKTASKMELYKNICATIQALLLKRTSMILDRLPTITQAIRRLVRVLCQWSSLKDVDENNHPDRGILSVLSYGLLGTFTALVKLKRELSRPAYLLHDLIVELTTHTLLTDVKQSILNCCYLLHALCDSHALKYLNTISNPGNRLMFKNIHDTYNKFYVFRGKI